MTIRMMSAVRWSARAAVGGGLFLALAEVVRNGGFRSGADWGYWPFWVVDYLAAGLLVAGGWAVLSTHRGRPATGARALLSGAWGFTLGMSYMSFFGHLETIDRADHGPLDHRTLTMAIGVLMVFAAAGFAASLARAPADGIASDR